MTSYDYDAPISEAGWVTPKYDSIRNVIGKYVDYVIPEVPAPNPVIEIPSIRLTESLMLAFAKRQEPVESPVPLTFEQLRQGYGYVLYTRHFNQPLAGMLEIPGLRDYATVYVNGERVGELNRYYNRYSVFVEIPFDATLDILVENWGRINFGEEIVNNRKGIVGPVTVNGMELSDWFMYRLPMDGAPGPDKTAEVRAGTPEASFCIVNLFCTRVPLICPRRAIRLSTCPLGEKESCLSTEKYRPLLAGRTPQQTLYVPGVWLKKKGENRIVIFEQLNDGPKNEISAVKVPILKELKS